MIDKEDKTLNEKYFLDDSEACFFEKNKKGDRLPCSKHLHQRELSYKITHCLNVQFHCKIVESDSYCDKILIKVPLLYINFDARGPKYTLANTWSQQKCQSLVKGNKGKLNISYSLTITNNYSPESNRSNGGSTNYLGTN